MDEVLRRKKESLSMDYKVPLFEVKEVGTIEEVKKGILRLKGLRQCMYGQLIETSTGIKGMVIGFDKDASYVLILGDEEGIRVGDQVSSIPELMSVGVGNQYLGRVVDSLGNPMDDVGDIESSLSYPVFREAKGVMDREPVDEPLRTGIKILDMVIPIGKGQRELVVGDRQTGKTAIGLDVIFNQKDKDVICIYCYIGGAYSRFKKIFNSIKQKGALPYTLSVCAPAASSIGSQFLAPYTAAALGEYFMFKGKDVVVIFDDLSKHAWVWREISLLLERSPGREAYPADIFFIHSQLMERAGKLNKELGNGSMTFFPITETLQGDITGYVQSNLVSMTDGQIYLSAPLFHQRFRPAIDLGLSVSRIGGKIQPPALRKLSKGLRLEYIQYRELLRLSKLQTSLSDEANLRIRTGEVLEELFIQQDGNPCSLPEEIILFYAFRRKILDVLTVQQIRQFKTEFLSYLEEENPALIEKIEEKKELTDDIKKELDRVLVDYFRKQKRMM